MGRHCDCIVSVVHDHDIPDECYGAMDNRSGRGMIGEVQITSVTCWLKFSQRGVAFSMVEWPIHFVPGNGVLGCNFHFPTCVSLYHMQVLRQVHS
jgi:hypothetical protein